MDAQRTNATTIKPIYLDYMATTPVDPQVAEAMASCLGFDGVFANSASTTHALGRQAQACIDIAREQVAALIHAEPHEIVWTSGATEADNLAIIGGCDFYQQRGKHIVTMSTEHKAVLDTCAFLEGRGYEVTYLKPDERGLLSTDALSSALRDDTVMVSILFVNNETGVIQPIDELAELVKAKGALLHVDAAQANGKLPINVKKTPVDLLSLSAHKVYGPKGVGALYVRSKPKVNLTPIIHGGHHQGGLRSGTLATHQVVGMGCAFARAAEQLQADADHARSLTDFLMDQLVSSGALIHGDRAHCVPHCINFSYPNVRSEALMLAIPEIALSSGSACNSATPLPSHVLLAMSVPFEQADCAVRLSVGRYTSHHDIQFATDVILRQASRLQSMASIAM